MTDRNKPQIHFERAGEVGSRVLLLHGWGCSMELMRFAANGLKAEHQVMMIDFPGFGKSPEPLEPWGVPEYAESLRSFLQEQDFLPCSVIAHSFGCRVAAYLAAEEPSLFEKLIFTGAAGIRPKQSEEARKRSEEYKRLKARYEGLKKFKILGSFPDRLEEKLRQKYGSADYNALNEEMRKTFVRVVNLDLTDRYPLIRQSTLLIWGDRDTETPLWMGQEMEKRIPDAGLVLFEGGTHFAYLEQPDRFLTVARHFLTEANG